MSERRTEQPLADINYGVGRRIQLKFEIPWLHVREHGESAGTGPGNADYGVKWRFLGEEGKRVAWSIYPPLEVNSSKTMLNKGLVADGPRFLLPTEFTVEMGHIEINGEVGRNVVRGGDDEWIYGVSTEITVRRGLELLGELHGEQSRESPVLLTAAGTAVHGLHDDRLRFRLYAGLQFNLPGQYAFGPHSNLKNDNLRPTHESDSVIGVTQRVDLPRARGVSSAS